MVLATKTEPELLELEARLTAGGIPHRAIREPSMGNCLTAIGVVPALKSSLRRWLSQIPLYR